jgi:hypothetical protein
MTLEQMVATGDIKFSPGQIVATRACIRKMDSKYASYCLWQHMGGNWGLVDEEDWAANDEALKHMNRNDGGRLLSSYPLPNDPDVFWIITEGAGRDRVTTYLLPCEY